jgi:hypothetical protein
MRSSVEPAVALVDSTSLASIFERTDRHRMESIGDDYFLADEEPSSIVCDPYFVPASTSRVRVESWHHPFMCVVARQDVAALKTMGV